MYSSHRLTHAADEEEEQTASVKCRRTNMRCEVFLWWSSRLHQGGGLMKDHEKPDEEKGEEEEGEALCVRKLPVLLLEMLRVELEAFRGVLQLWAWGKRWWYLSKRRYFTVTSLPVKIKALSVNEGCLEYWDFFQGQRLQWYVWLTIEPGAVQSFECFPRMLCWKTFHVHTALKRKTEWNTDITHSYEEGKQI